MKASAVSSIREGFRLASRQKGAAGVLFAANLALAALASLPIYNGLLEFTGFSSLARDLASGFSADWFVDFSFNRPGALERYANFIFYAGILALPVNAILSGGILGRFRAPEAPFSFRDFFRDCRRRAWPMLRLTFIGLICYWLVFRTANVWLRQWVEDRTFNTLDDRIYFWPHLGVSLLVILGIGLVNLVMDFSRVRLIMVEGSTALEAFSAALGFVLIRMPRAILVSILPSAVGILLLILYRLAIPWHLVSSSTGTGGIGSPGAALALSLLFGVQQLVMFARYWLRVAAWASEWAFYESSTASHEAQHN